jgi:hypothetical protein
VGNANNVAVGVVERVVAAGLRSAYGVSIGRLDTGTAVITAVESVFDTLSSR